MVDLYSSIKNLCDNNGITIGKMCDDIGVSKGILTDLKMGRKKSISIATASKIANYFDVSVDYLLGEDEQRKPLVNNDEELTEYLEMLKTRPECKTFFQLSKGASKADVEKALKIVEAFLKDEG